jgi:hypothetical protein
VKTCGECGAKATQKAEWVFPVIDEERDIYGVEVALFYCDEHLAELVRTTTKRYTITPLPRGKRATSTQGEQQCFEGIES